MALWMCLLYMKLIINREKSLTGMMLNCLIRKADEIGLSGKNPKGVVLIFTNDMDAEEVLKDVTLPMLMEYKSITAMVDYNHSGEPLLIVSEENLHKYTKREQETILSHEIGHMYNWTIYEVDKLREYLIDVLDAQKVGYTLTYAICDAIVETRADEFPILMGYNSELYKLRKQDANKFKNLGDDAKNLMEIYFENVIPLLSSFELVKQYGIDTENDIQELSSLFEPYIKPDMFQKFYKLSLDIVRRKVYCQPENITICC